MIEKQNGAVCFGSLFILLLTLLIDGSALVWRMRVGRRVAHLAIALVDHSTTRSTILTRYLAFRGLVPNGRKLRANTTTVRWWLSLGGVRGARAIDLVGLRLSSHALTVFGSLALSFFFLLASLPFLANFLEF